MSKFDLFSSGEYTSRHLKLRNRVKPDLSIIFNRSDLFYYSGTGLDGVIVENKKEATLERYVQRNLNLAREESVVETNEMVSFRLFKEIAVKYPNLESIGLELDLLPYRTVEYIQKAFGGLDIVDIGQDLRMIRSVKSNKEQDYMKLACKQTDESFEYIHDKIKPGMTEIEIAAMIEYFLRRDGHPGFINVRMFHHNLTSLSMVMSGESTATLNSKFGPVSGAGICKIHKNGPSKRKIKENDQLLIDTTGVFEGYTADETRTFFFGKQNDILIDAYNFTKELHNFVESNMKAGALPSDLFAKMWTMASEYGFNRNFMGIENDVVPFIGHGVGLELDDLPIITDKYSQPLEIGNTIAVEPKLIFDDPKTGVGIEDTYIVLENKAERITQTPW